MKDKIKRPEFKIRLTNNPSVTFVPNKFFIDASLNQVLKVINSKKLIIGVNAMNKGGYVNFNLRTKLTNGNLIMIGHINYFDNDLNDNSTDKDRNIVITELQELLRMVKLKDVCKIKK
jgi:hypothetical protein